MIPGMRFQPGPLICLVAALVAAGSVPAQGSVQALEQPEAASGRSVKAGWHFEREAVSAANPLAAQAGAQVLRAGGSAMDAAVAVQLVLGLVEPQSSGIGGGAFLMHWDGKRVQSFDGRETAPAAATPELFLRDGKPLPMREAVSSGLSTGAPGVLAMLELAHRQQGRLPWARLFEPAIRLAEQGFALSPRLHELLSSDARLAHDPQAGPLWFDTEGRPRAVGSLVRNPAYAAVLRAVAEHGSRAFYTGAVAQDIVARVRGHERPGLLAAADLAGYRALERAPLCSNWRRFRVCGFGPPSSGQLTLMQVLGLLDQQPSAKGATAISLPWLHAYTEASKLAFADRAQYIADPGFVAAPGGDWLNLLAPDYLRERAALIGDLAMKPAKAGRPGRIVLSHAAQVEQLESGTSHISIVDAAGRAVSMTTTVESAFGNGVMSDGGTGLPGGFMLNNQLTDFSLNPRGADGLPVANRVEPGKRPRSSMAPTLVFEGQRLILVAGSPGGPVIIHYLAKLLTGHLAWGLPLQQAVDLPNFGNFNGPALIVERGALPASLLDGLRAKGHQIIEADLTSGLQALSREGKGWAGAADPRREGIVAGD